MRVLITGGTGFVGSHTVAAVRAAGHEVRLLARSHERAARVLGPLSAEASDVVIGDVLDESKVAEALDGVDAVIHAANVYSFRPQDRLTMAAVNEAGTERVLGMAVARGLDPIFHVSSFVALLPARGIIDADAPIGAPAPPYARSKVRAEQVARRHQEQGAPVVITYPGVVLGPNDPYAGESTAMVRAALTGRLHLTNDGWMPVSDVRDVAEVHARVLEPGRGARRYLATGHDVVFRELLRRIGANAGRNLWSVAVSAGVARSVGGAADLMARGISRPLPIHGSGPWIVAHCPRFDTSATSRDLGVTWRPLDTTLADTVRWLVEAGHVRPRSAPAVA